MCYKGTEFIENFRYQISSLKQKRVVSMSIALHYSFRKIDYETLCDDNEIPKESVEQVYLKACDLIKFPDWLMRLKNFWCRGLMGDRRRKKKKKSLTRWVLT